MSTSSIQSPGLDPQDVKDNILCYYVNHSPKIQVLRIQSLMTGVRFEKVVFPGQRLFFDALRFDSLEVFTQAAAATVSPQRIPCLQLQVREGVTAV